MLTHSKKPVSRDVARKENVIIVKNACALEVRSVCTQCCLMQMDTPSTILEIFFGLLTI